MHFALHALYAHINIIYNAFGFFPFKLHQLFAQRDINEESLLWPSLPENA